jgi:hypothetical protein
MWSDIQYGGTVFMRNRAAGMQFYTSGDTVSGVKGEGAALNILLEPLFSHDKFNTDSFKMNLDGKSLEGLRQFYLNETPSIFSPSGKRDISITSEPTLQNILYYYIQNGQQERVTRYLKKILEGASIRIEEDFRKAQVEVGETFARHIVFTRSLLEAISLTIRILKGMDVELYFDKPFGGEVSFFIDTLLTNFYLDGKIITSPSVGADRGGVSSSIDLSLVSEFIGFVNDFKSNHRVPVIGTIKFPERFRLEKVKAIPNIQSHLKSAITEMIDIVDVRGIASQAKRQYVIEFIRRYGLPPKVDDDQASAATESESYPDHYKLRFQEFIKETLEHKERVKNESTLKKKSQREKRSSQRQVRKAEAEAHSTREKAIEDEAQKQRFEQSVREEQEMENRRRDDLERYFALEEPWPTEQDELRRLETDKARRRSLDGWERIPKNEKDMSYPFVYENEFTKVRTTKFTKVEAPAVKEAVTIINKTKQKQNLAEISGKTDPPKWIDKLSYTQATELCRKLHLAILERSNYTLRAMIREIKDYVSKPPSTVKKSKKGAKPSKRGGGYFDRGYNVDSDDTSFHPTYTQYLFTDSCGETGECSLTLKSMKPAEISVDKYLKYKSKYLSLLQSDLSN